jgi:chromatin remodeling complex protein RSC6
MSIPSDEVIAAALKELLKTANFEEVTPKVIRRQLGAQLGCDLTEKKAFISGEINAFIDAQQAAQATSSEESSSESEAEEEPAAPPPAKRPKVGGLGVSRAGPGDSPHGPTSCLPCISAHQTEPGTAASSKKAPKTPAGPSGYQRPCLLEPSLANFFGVSEMTRSEATKRVWAHIKEKGLQSVGSGPLSCSPHRWRSVDHVAHHPLCAVPGPCRWAGSTVSMTSLPRPSIGRR